MKILEISTALNSEEVHEYDGEFEDDTVITTDSGYFRIADTERCVFIEMDGLFSIGLVPVEQGEEDDSLCNSHCACHDDQFDCEGACKNRCYECAHQDKVIKP